MFAAENYRSPGLGNTQALRGQVLPHLSRQIHAYMIQEAALKWFFRDTDSNNMCNIYWLITSAGDWAEHFTFIISSSQLPLPDKHT